MRDSIAQAHATRSSTSRFSYLVLRPGEGKNEGSSILREIPTEKSRGISYKSRILTQFLKTNTGSAKAVTSLQVVLETLTSRTQGSRGNSQSQATTQTSLRKSCACNADVSEKYFRFTSSKVWSLNIPHLPPPSRHIPPHTHTHSHSRGRGRDNSFWDNITLGNSFWGNTTWGNTTWGSTTWGSTTWGNTPWGNILWGNTTWGNTNWGNTTWKCEQFSPQNN
ncbi:hypothetical protein FHG87_013870 [Trinorchestia longiramus]|nr:hypothetical protein FHG87_013870 [Trinorchestia longiramus]